MRRGSRSSEKSHFECASSLFSHRHHGGGHVSALSSFLSIWLRLICLSAGVPARSPSFLVSCPQEKQRLCLPGRWGPNPACPELQGHTQDKQGPGGTSERAPNIQGFSFSVPPHTHTHTSMKQTFYKAVLDLEVDLWF